MDPINLADINLATIDLASVNLSSIDLGGGERSTWRRGADFLTDDFNGDFRNVATN